MGRGFKGSKGFPGGKKEPSCSYLEAQVRLSDPGWSLSIGQNSVRLVPNCPLTELLVLELKPIPICESILTQTASRELEAPPMGGLQNEVILAAWPAAPTHVPWVKAFPHTLQGIL